MESHHIASAFELMLGDPNNNWAVKMPVADYQRVRQLMIDCVLATDMSLHMKDLNLIKAKQNELNLQENETDRLMLIKYAFHLADISNPVKRWDLCRDWTDLLFVEFFA